MSNSTIKSLKRWIKETQTQHDDAKARGETDAYLAILRVKLDELNAALSDAEQKAKKQ